MTPTIKCAIYARFSTENQREASVEDQIRRCREVATSKGWQVLDDFIMWDKAISGQSLRGRSGLKKLLEIGKSNHAPFSYIIVDDASRVARNTRDALQVAEELKFHKIGVYYVSQGIDSLSETSGMAITLQSMVDAQQIQSISKNTHRGVEGQFLKGLSTGGRRYGYRSFPIHNGKIDIYGNPETEGYVLRIEPKEAEVVREIYRLFGEMEFSPKEIAEIMNSRLQERGEPKPHRGESWRASTISGSLRNKTGILNNPIYIGQRYWNRTKTKKNPNSGAKISEKRMPNEWKLLEDPSLVIVPNSLWQKVKDRQRAVVKRSDGQFTKAKKLYSPHLLTGLARCAECGGTVGIVSGGKYYKYGCTTKWNKGISACSNSAKIDGHLLEEQICVFLAQELTDAQHTKRLHAEFTSNMRAYIQSLVIGQNSSSEIEDKIKLQKEKIRHIVDAIMIGGITKSFHSALQEAETEKAELINQLSLTNADEMDKVTKIISEEDMKFHFAKMSEGLGLPERAKESLESVVEEILVDCRSPGAVCIKIVEKIDGTTEYLLNLLHKRDGRIRLQTGSRFIPYTTNIWQFILTANASFDSTGFPGKIIILEEGIYEKGSSK